MEASSARQRTHEPRWRMSGHLEKRVTGRGSRRHTLKRATSLITRRLNIVRWYKARPEDEPFRRAPRHRYALKGNFVPVRLGLIGTHSMIWKSLRVGAGARLDVCTAPGFCFGD